MALSRRDFIREEGRGILTSRDIAEELGSEYREGNQLSYWTCFDARDVTIKCIDVGKDHNGQMSDINIVAFRTGERHEYGYRHAVNLSVCRNVLGLWRNIREKQKRVCIQGNQAGESSIQESSGRITSVYTWVWDRTKTRLGCISYWGEQCEGP